MGTRSTLTHDTIFFDGVCNLCNGAINFVIDRDSNKRYKFASLQSEFAQSQLPISTSSIDSIILFKKSGDILYKSNAALEISRNLKGLWPVLYIFKIVPRFIRDFVYDWVAKNRYKWFGKRDTCRMPSPELKERFLEAS
ncbi:MAG: thiol-disulfide oxidoreductase DCC family protein [Fulvivirga sp.]